MEEKKKKFPVVTVIIIIIGLVMFGIGFMIFCFGNKDYIFDKRNLVGIEESYDAKEINELKLDFGIGKFTIKAEDTDKIKVIGRNIPKDTVKVEAKDNKFTVKTVEQEWYKNISLSFRKDREDTVFDIIIPAKEYYKVDIDCGVGDCTFDGIIASNFDLDGGVGSISMTNSQIGRSDIDAGVGSIDFQGKIVGDADIDMGVGQVKFDVDGNRDDYDIKMSGNVKIDYDKTGSENTNKIKISIDNGIGEAKFKFN